MMLLTIPTARVFQPLLTPAKHYDEKQDRYRKGAVSLERPASKKSSPEKAFNETLLPMRRRGLTLSASLLSRESTCHDLQ
jgi:hypothetical protein